MSKTPKKLQPITVREHNQLTHAKTKFKFKDTVEATYGFYLGHQGIVVHVRDYPSAYIEYEVVFDSAAFMQWSLSRWMQEDHLKLVRRWKKGDDT